MPYKIRTPAARANPGSSSRSRAYRLRGDRKKQKEIAAKDLRRGFSTNRRWLRNSYCSLDRRTL
jgi:hypothetical protein